MSENKNNAMLYQHHCGLEGTGLNYNFYFNHTRSVDYYKRLQNENPIGWAGFSFIKDYYIKRD